VEGLLNIFPLSPITNLSGLSQLTGARDLEVWESGLLGWTPTQGENLGIYFSNFEIDPNFFTLQEFTSGYTTLNYIDFANWIYEATPGFTFFDNLTSVDTLRYDASSTNFEATIPNLTQVNYIYYSNNGSLTTPLYLPNLTNLNSLYSEDICECGPTPYSTPIFSSLNHIDFVQVFQLEVIDGFIGLSSLTSIGTFDMREMHNANSLEGLANIQTADILNIDSYNYENPQPFIGLESLQSVGRLRITWSSFSGDLSTLSNLQTVDSLMLGFPIGNFPLEGPTGLTSLQGIENVTINNYLSIIGQDLSFCSVPSVCNFISSHGPEDYYIDVSNPLGCSSVEEIIALCSPNEVTILGSVFFDLDCNGNFDLNEFALSPSTLEAIPSADIFLGLENYVINAAPNSSITLSAGGLPPYYTPASSINITTPPFGGNIINQNIGVCAAFPFQDIQASLLSYSNLVPGFGANLILQVQNFGSTTSQIIPTMVLNTDQFIENFNVVDSQFAGTIAGNTITWPELSIYPGQAIDLWIYLELLPTATILGETFSASASVALVSGSDENPADNTALFEQEIIGAYDPNDKWVNTPQINIEEVDPSQPLDLTYRVRFQNTGTAPAVNVRVEDVLEEDLDPSTFQLLSSTHEVYYQIEGNQINFFFNDIMLPDSTSDSEGSIGTFFFRIKSNGNHSLESSIDNQVSIFFDFNEPIITNVASTIFYNCPLVNISGEGVDLCAGEEIELSAVASNNTSIQWFVNEEVVGSDNSYLFSFDTPNDYSVLVVAENEYCIDEDELEITVNENPEVTLNGNGNTLVATEGFASYQWTLDGNIIEGENGNTITSTILGNYVVTVTNEFGCTDESNVVEIVDGIDENESKAIVLWPNPVRDVVNIRSDYRGVATIVDMQGKQVMNLTLNGQTTLDLSGLPSGIYQITSSVGLLGQFIKE
jgi:uncharacterized repeat protein (TIGR01451 family)